MSSSLYPEDRLEKNKSRLITFIISYVIWVLMAGFDGQHLFMGLIVSAIVALTMGDLMSFHPHKFLQIRRYWLFVIYSFLFIWECIKANIDVALRVINPKLPINPGIVKVKTSLKSETAITMLANSITLTPGTFVVDVDKENGFLYIHWIDVKTQDVDEATKIIPQIFEKLLKEIFE